MPVVATLSRRPGEEWYGYIRRLPYPYGGGGRSEGAEEEEDKSTRIRLEGVNFEDLDLEVGDLMTIEVVLEQKDDVMWLPPQAVRKFEGREFVVIQDGEVQRRVDVKVGIESQDRVEIEEGLSEGQIVVGP
jgi:multidrug efflux pump subunit AcrA (membrane-fusion protein)